MRQRSTADKHLELSAARQQLAEQRKRIQCMTKRLWYMHAVLCHVAVCIPWRV